MQGENPTAGDGGASISSRLESFLAASEGDSTTQPAAPAAERKEEDQQAPETNATEVEAQPESDAQSEVEGPQLSITDLAKYLGVDESALDVSDDGAVLVKTKIDGKDGAAKFKDMLKSYQLQGHVDNKAREAADAQKSLQERVNQFEAYAQSRSEQLDTLANIAQQELLAEYGAVDWTALSQQDPAAYVAEQHKFQQRQGRVTQLMTAAQQQKQQYEQATAQKAQLFHQQEVSRLPSLIPEWSDEKVREAEKSELRNWCKTQGFSDHDLASLNRAEMVVSLRKAMLFDKGKTAVAATEKKVRLAPKLVKPGQSTDARQRADEGVQGLKNTIRKSGGKSGVADYLLATGKV